MTNQKSEDLANFQLLFGHLNINDTFQINNEHYQKIGLYTTSSGKKINTVQLTKTNHYFSYHDFDKIKEAHFVYFEDDTPIGVRNYTYLGYGPKFHENLLLTLPGYFVDNPVMLDVIDCLFQEKPLSTLLQEVLEKYEDYLFHVNEYAPIPPNYTVEEIQQKVIEKNIKENRDKIMLEIDSEVARYRRELIKKRLGD